MRRLIIYGLIFILSCLVIIWWPVNDSNCSFITLAKLKKDNFQVTATKVSVRPWLGQHHIYGIFQVPDSYKESQFFMLSIPGGRQYCARPFGYSENYDDVFAQPGNILIRYYVPTRIGTKMIFQGLFFELNNPQNWSLTFPIKTS
ncbi:hypothetical protein [Cylindrospermopsis curvispora]|uniref:Uncharacterized protein n=1 Tax=Cylindrospermopsis curvispora GIHE-G1 TaxID=2666332 RepID=A0A7H0EY19_9CYAN|nr:hypothetical protein [Cylindrospermopsis curvispora]QNP28685.1 hypothetical protein IAR63_12345 [Cylindrospermopsis curvispora GIHE-G1]